MQTAEVAKVKADNAKLQREVLGSRMHHDSALTQADLTTIAAIVPPPRQVSPHACAVCHICHAGFRMWYLQQVSRLCP